MRAIFFFCFSLFFISPGVVGYGQLDVQPGEHPRLFFRRAQLDEIREKAKTPVGQQIVTRLRYQLNSGDGRSLPERTQPLRETLDNAGPLVGEPVGSVFTLWHGAGYGMLYQLTGDPHYAALGKTSVDMMLSGVRDRDARYSFRDPKGALRAGPSLAAMAMAYDLCYDGWDPAFRKKIALEIQNYNEGKFKSIEELARGSRHHADSNHWGPQIGGAALGALAIYGDPGTDSEKAKRILDTSISKIDSQLRKGLGTRGYFTEGMGPGQIATDTALVPALHALQVTGARDVSQNETARWTTLRWPMMLYEFQGRPAYLNPVKSSTYGGQMFERHGLSRGGQFVQGMGLLTEQQQAMLLWSYATYVYPSESKWPLDAGVQPGQVSYDTVNPYPHRAIFALVNWPIGLKPLNPTGHLPHYVKDARHPFHFWRKRWQDRNDPMVMCVGPGKSLGGGLTPVRIHGYGQLFAARPEGGSPRVKTIRKDQAWTVQMGSMKMAIDFTGKEPVILASGAAFRSDMPEAKSSGNVNLDGTWLGKQGQPVERGMVIKQQGSSLSARLKRKAHQKWGEGTVQGSTVVMTFTSKRGDVKVKGEVLANGTQIKWDNGTSWFRPDFKAADFVYQPGGKSNLRTVRIDGEALSVITFDSGGSHPPIQVKGNEVRVGEVLWIYENGAFRL